ncbi:hypothetical protein KP509_33G031000 [Ceratopteris richardii]|uniref:GOLD domain-containing protein n=1 Tax=Ceratopteris richardii TaxID=49495 RepID=A0A8T2QMU8_CERRI|nr:hypothetical protein KP509_33G031000 [Ceratopteris richardii]
MAAMKNIAILLFTVLSVCLFSTQAVRFVLRSEECFHQTVDYDGDHVQVSFVVIRAENAWNHNHHIHGIDLKIEGPNQFRQEAQGKASEKLEFIATHHGPYKFCLKNNSPYSELVDFSLHVGHASHGHDKVQDDHVSPLMTQIEKLEKAIYSVRFEQHWLYAQTKQQAIVNDNISKRVVQRAFLEAMALVGVSALQVYLIRRLFKTKLGYSRV